MGSSRRHLTEEQRRHLRMWREAAGYSQTQVEKYFSWSQPKVSNIELGKQHITPEDIGYLAHLYGCTPAELFSPPSMERMHGILTPTKAARQRTNGLATALEIIGNLLREHEAIKTDLTAQVRGLKQRLDKSEKQLRLAAQAITDSVKSTAELASMFDHSATMLRAASQLPSLEPEPTDQDDAA